MIGNNFHHKTIPGVALTPQTVNAGAANGAPIEQPFRVGRQIGLTLIGDIPATSVIQVTIEGRLRIAATWSPVLDKDGNPLAFTASRLGPTQDLDGGFVLGTVLLANVDWVSFSAIRIVAANAAATDAIIGATYHIFDLYNGVAGSDDDLFEKQFVTYDG